MIRKLNEIKAQRRKEVRKKKMVHFCLEDFDVGETLGTGTFGRVRLGRCEKTAKCHALKIMKKSNVIELKQVDHINSEIKILSKINHPFIVNMDGYFQNSTNIYVVLEFVQGGELYTYLRKEERLSNDTARFYAMEVVVCFEYLHQADIVYRDLKPENLLITADGHLKITDFGFAKELKDGLAWTLCGTPEYLAPEIIQSQGHGFSVDWWTLGILLFEMLAGYPPFHDDNPFGIYSKILTSNVEYPRIIESKAKSLIKKLLNRDLTKRLGCVQGKALSIKSHKWFAQNQWDDVLSSDIKVPYKPSIQNSEDSSHFDDYSDSDCEDISISEDDQTLFKSWDY